GVAGGRERVAGRTQTFDARQGVRVEVVELPCRGGLLDAENLPDAAVMLAARRQPAENAHHGEARHADGVGGALPPARFVDERLADVEDDGLYSHPRTRSRSSGVVTLSRRSSPST